MNPKKFFKEVEMVVAVSENTKRDLVDLYQISEEKIKVIYPGVVVPPSVIPRSVSDEESRGRSPASGGINSATTHEINGSRVTSSPRDSSVVSLPQNDDLEAAKQKFGLPEKFVLFLGTIEPRKNVLGIIRAFEAWKRNPELSKDYHLVLAGFKGWSSKNVWRAISKSPCKNQIKYLGPVSEEEKFALYRSASLFLYPSFYEGFGFPPLEAMGCGVAVIASANSSFPEVLGDAALLVNPYDTNDIANGIEMILGNDNIREQFVGKGLEQVKKFSWQKAAEEWMDLIKRL